MRRKHGVALRSFRVLSGDLQWRVLLQVIHKENLAVKYLQAADAAARIALQVLNCAGLKSAITSFMS
jgi:hypothetical protein